MKRNLCISHCLGSDYSELIEKVDVESDETLSIRIYNVENDKDKSLLIKRRIP